MLPLTKREGPKASPEPPRFEPVPGTVVAEKYRIERTLGEGGMGVVVAATHMALEQSVAIKFLLPDAMRSEVAVERFLREARVAAKIRSDHVARVHDAGTLDGGTPYIVMEHLVGRDLGEVIAQDGALPIDEVCEIGIQACEALGEVHAAGIVHRDLKPSNLFVTRRADGSPAVKLLDFGISKLTLGDDLGVDPALTATATIMGSPSYMSPEQLKSTKEVDGRTDVWSLGAVLYEAVTGKPAFRAESVPQVCAMIASEDPRPPSAYRESIPPDLDRAILACLEKDADERIALADLAHALACFAPERAKPSLQRIDAVLGTSRKEATGKTSLPVLPLATAGRRPARGGGMLLLLLLGIVGVLVGGIVTGKVTVPRLPSDLASATNLVSSAATAMTSAVSSAIASSLPALAPTAESAVSAGPSLLPSSHPPAPPAASGPSLFAPSGAPSGTTAAAPPASAASDDEDGEEAEDAEAAPTASADAGHGVAPAVAPTHGAAAKGRPTKKHPGKRRHHG